MRRVVRKRVAQVPLAKPRIAEQPLRVVEEPEAAPPAAKSKVKPKAKRPRARKIAQVWTCTKCAHEGPPDDFGWRQVPVQISAQWPTGRKPARQPQCKACRRVASKKTRDRARRAQAARRGWVRRKARARRMTKAPVKAPVAAK